MPLTQVLVIKDVFSKEQKRQITSNLTDAMVSIEGEDMRGGSRFQKSRAANGASAASLSS